jgi:type IX secretion system PorP/SprF family membrane protein
MKNYQLKTILVCALVIGITRITYAQLEMQGSQYLFDRTYVNPAFSGTQGFANANLHFQMNNLKNTSNGKDHTLSAAGAIELKKAKSAIGFNIVKSTFGNDGYGMGYGNFVYHLPVNENVTFSTGASVGIQQFNMNVINLLTSQPNDPLSMNNVYSSKVEARLGVQSTLYKNYYVGISFDNILSGYSKKEDYSAQIPPTFRRTNLYLIGGANIPTSTELSLQPSLLFINNFGGITTLDINVIGTIANKISLGVGMRQEVEEYQSVAVGNDKKAYKQSIIRPMIRYLVPTGKDNAFKIGYCFNINSNNSVGLARNSHDLSVSFAILNK